MMTPMEEAINSEVEKYEEKRMAKEVAQLEHDVIHHGKEGDSLPKPKRRRNYAKKAMPETVVPVPAPPEPPNPVVIQMQQALLPMVDERELLQRRITELQDHLAQNQRRIQQIDAAIQYRMNLIGQMTGKPAMGLAQTGGAIYGPPPSTLYVNADDMPNGYGVTIPDGVSSIPAPRPMQPSYDNPTVRSESAMDMRMEALKSRAVI